jgi:hypothetical protein
LLVLNRIAFSIPRKCSRTIFATFFISSIPECPELTGGEWQTVKPLYGIPPKADVYARLDTGLVYRLKAPGKGCQARIRNSEFNHRPSRTERTAGGRGGVCCLRATLFR